MRQILVLSVLAGLSTGCSTVSYLFQATRGQMEIFQKARPIPEVLQDERTPPYVIRLLEEIPRIKSFGEATGLKPTHNYTEYVALDRPAASWVVSACEPLQFNPKQWAFPIVGSFTYLGWFDLEDARKHAERLKKEGWDVDVRGAAAYSTLGWFNDPVLSTMLSRGEDSLGKLVNLILHESVHATLYIPNQSYFNESLASFVADRLAPVYLKKTYGAKSPELSSYLESEERSEKYARAFQRAYRELDEVYASGASEAEKLQKKEAILSTLQEKTESRRAINNATLIQFRTYGIGKAEFSSLYRACGGDWRRFFASLEALGNDSFKTPQAENIGEAILPLAREGCPAPEAEG